LSRMRCSRTASTSRVSDRLKRPTRSSSSIAFSEEDACKKIIDTHTFKTLFNDGWDSIGVRFERLRQFFGSLATILANTTSVESDFSILKWEKDEFRSALMDKSLEGMFQSKQYEILMNILKTIPSKSRI
jgi:hypothetical protein